MNNTDFFHLTQDRVLGQRLVYFLVSEIRQLLLSVFGRLRWFSLGFILDHMLLKFSREIIW